MKTAKNIFYSQDDIGIKRVNDMLTNRTLRSKDQIKLEEYIKESQTKYENEVENNKKTPMMPEITDVDQLKNGNLYGIEFKDNDDIEYCGKKSIGLFDRILGGSLKFTAIYCFQKQPMITIKEIRFPPIEHNKYTIYKLSDARYLVNQADNLVNNARKSAMNQILSQLIPYNNEYMDMYPNDVKENILDTLSYRFPDTQRYTSKKKGGYSKRNRRNKSKKNKSNKNHKLN